MSFRVGIDIGGTFTDFVSISDTGDLALAKVSSNSEDVPAVVRAGLQQLATHHPGGLDGLMAETEIVVHGTTIATNALIQGTLAKSAMICTRGFRDLLELREGLKEERYNPFVAPPPALVPRHLRLAVTERIGPAGEILTPLEETDVAKIIQILRSENVDAVSVCLLWSVVNPVHEERVRDLLEARLPGVPVYLSSRVSPRIREYPRYSTTALCAALDTKLRGYVASVEANLRGLGYPGAIRYIQCNGGTTSRELLETRPVAALHSGPAAGPAAALFFGRGLLTGNLVTFDMGGTSLDVGLVHDGEIETAKDLDVHGYRVSLPMVKVRTLGAGGGSIAWVDESGMLRIGPRSAEATPGPACYARGGGAPTVTDANVVLGYFNPESLLGGSMPIDAALATEAIRREVAEPLGLKPRQAALAIYTVVNNNMANAVHQSSTEQGYDLRDFTLVCGGGCSAAHAARVAESAGMEKVLIPRVSAALCSFGAAVTDVRHDYATSYHTRFAGCDAAFVEQAFCAMGKLAREDLAQEGFDPIQMRLERQMDVRYLGELGELTLPVPDEEFTPERLREMEESFHLAHEQTYTFADRASECEIMGLSLVARGLRRDEISELNPAPTGDASDRTMSRREALFSEGLQSVDVYPGDTLEVDAVIEGPAIIEETTTTIVIPPEWRVRLDPCHAWVMWRGA